MQTYDQCEAEQYKSRSNHFKIQLGYAEADLLEAYKSIVNNCMFDSDCGIFCIHCGAEKNFCTDMLIHKEGCIVDKATQYIKGIECKEI